MHSGPFGCNTKLGAKRAELVQKFVPRSRIKFFHNESTQSSPLDPKLKFWCVSYYSGAFGTVWLPYETRCKTSRTSAKVCATKLHLNFFAMNATDPTHWTLNLHFGVFSHYLGAFRTIWLPYETRCKTGRTSAKVRVTKSRRNFSQQTRPIHPIGP